MNRGYFISFEGTEGSGKSTQARRLAERLRALGRIVRLVREPGGTPLAEEIRQTLKHSPNNAGITPETELLLICASRAQLVREVIRPALAAGEVVVCDRFHDSSVAYQGYGRGINLEQVRAIIDFAVGETRPDLTLLLHVSLEVSEARRHARQLKLPLPEQKQPKPGAAAPLPAFVPDRFEEADRDFFKRVEEGYLAIAAAEPQRVKLIEAAGSEEDVFAQIWRIVEPLVTRKPSF